MTWRLLFFPPYQVALGTKIEQWILNNQNSVTVIVTVNMQPDTLAVTDDLFRLKE